MKKRILLALMALLAVTCVAGCSKDNNANVNVGGSSDSISGSVSGDDSSSGEVEATTYSFTKVHNPMDRMNGATITEVEEGDALDLSAPAEVVGKVFKGWCYADGTAVEEGTVMGTEAVTIYADWEITAYTVTVKQDGQEDKTFKFGVESDYDDLENPIIGVDELAFVLEGELPAAEGETYYAFAEGLPETWELQDYTFTVVSKVKTYVFTKIDGNPRMGGAVTQVELKAGDALDLAAPAEVEGKVFNGWVDGEGNVYEGTEMPSEELTLYADWTITPYTVTLTMNGEEYKTFTFGVEDDYRDIENPIIGIMSIGFVIEGEIPENTDLITYTVELPEEWALQNYEINITKVVDLSSIVEKGIAAGDKVTNGTLVSTSGGYVIDDVAYELAENYAKLVVKDGEDTTEKYFIGYGDDSVLALVKYSWSENPSKSYDEIKPDMVNGYAFETVFDYENTYYGIEEFVSVIYSLEGIKFADVMEEEGETIYSFGVLYVNESGSTYIASVAFTLNDEDVMDMVAIHIDTYYGEIAETPDRTFDYMITQASDGEVTVAYDPAEVLVQSYTLTDAEGAEVEALDVILGDETTLNIADVAETANLNWETFTVTVLDADSVEVEGAVEVSVDTWSKAITVKALEEGEFTVTIQSAFVTKEITVTATMPETTEIYACTDDWGYNRIETAEIYADATQSFYVKANAYADASATVAIVSQPEGAEASVEEVQGEWTFTPDVAGEYVIKITSDVNEELTWTITITAKEIPNVVEEFFAFNEYQNEGKTFTNNWKLLFVTVDDITQLFATFEGEVYDRNSWEWVDVKSAALYFVDYNAETKEIALTATSAEDAQPVIDEMAPGFTLDQTLISSVTMNDDYTMSVAYGNNMADLEPWADFAPIDYVVGN